MWASIVLFCLLSQAVGVSKNQLRGISLSNRNCARQASEKCKNICEACKCYNNCNDCDLQAEWANTLTSHNQELDIAHEASANLCLDGNVETMSNPFSEFFEKLDRLPEARKIEIKKCEKDVANFCIQSKMCVIFCELKGESIKKDSSKCTGECVEKGRCAAKAPGAPDSFKNDALPNKELDVQTTDQLMQCIAETRDAAVGEKTSGRREGHWQDVTTYGLDKLGVFQRIDYEKLIKHKLMVESNDEEKNAVRSFQLSEEIERKKNNAASEDEGYSSN